MKHRDILALGLAVLCMGCVSTPPPRQDKSATAALSPSGAAVQQETVAVTEWKTESIPLPNRGEKARLEYRCPAEWTIDVDRLFGKLVFRKEKEVELTYISNAISNNATLLRASAKNTVQVIQEDLAERGFRFKTVSEEFGAPTKNLGHFSTPPSIHSLGRRVLQGERDERRYWVRIEADVSYFEDGLHNYVNDADIQGFGNATVATCPLDSACADVFDAIGASIHTSY